MAAPSQPLKSATMRGGSEGSPCAKKITSCPRTIGDRGAPAVGAQLPETMAPARLTKMMTGMNERARPTASILRRHGPTHYHVGVKRSVCVTLLLVLTIVATDAV